MDDSDHLCPLCCEEFDISDQKFYPCKCGYQVCMWCWHRIRESESGLCPACRTPYGDDPHAFSAVDVEEVLKANKEKAAAEKKSKDGDVDRTLLANMRVIRRNLVYAVGLPPLNEEVLRKPEYFGQYGKINKIVMNRNTTGVRASASAYVTFFHKVRFLDFDSISIVHFSPKNSFFTAGRYTFVYSSVGWFHIGRAQR